MKQILLTGFTKFHTHLSNPSEAVVNELSGSVINKYKGCVNLLLIMKNVIIKINMEIIVLNIVVNI